ncbi:hypothetical protein [Arthrobacter sp. S39]|uniref:hypothetical protein n=1 Tax=Arthrobacter sp. S39 TaxID=2509720 RepID=UPI001037D51C|nr:hypothetical protein [Arthrobacter sp. S39]TAP45621.1 hypothetical protein EYS21_02580 [Arthrobacter sp. S39]
MSQAILKAKSQLGVAHRRHNPEAITAARRDLAAEKLAAYVEKIVNEAPPLTREQRDRIASLLAPNAADESTTAGGQAA